MEFFVGITKIFIKIKTLNLKKKTPKKLCIVQESAQYVWTGRLTSQQFGVAVDELRFSFRDEPLTCVMQDLDKHALLSSWTRSPLVRSVLKYQVKLWAILNIFGWWEAVKDQWHQTEQHLREKESTHSDRVDAVDLPQLTDGPLWSPDERRGAFKLLHLREEHLRWFLIGHCNKKENVWILIKSLK